MTVRDIVAATADYQDYDLIIYKFGGIEKLWKGSNESCHIPYTDKKVIAIKFTEGLLKLILDINQV